MGVLALFIAVWAACSRRALGSGPALWSGTAPATRPAT